MEHAWILMADGARLAATLYLPYGAVDAPVACLLEALPYRKDDLTASYRPEYRRFCQEYGYAVARVDLRGTGSSSGLALDEYHPQEQADLHQVIEWLALQPWCTGAVGMFGTSWSGFNALQMAAERPPALRAVVATHATDDRWTDDVHYQGGALRLLDQIDYPLYMVAMQGLPPVPARFGTGWRQEWLARIEGTPPWLLEWLTQQSDGPYWRHGSVRATPGPACAGAGAVAGEPSYERIGCPTLIIAGWADGYRNNTFRTFRALAATGTPVEVLVGPWSHMAPATSVPGPRVDHVVLMARWWDRWLRPAPPDGPGPGQAAQAAAGHHQEPAAPFTVFVRRYAPPSPRADLWPGRWDGHDLASLDAGRELVLELVDATMSGPVWPEPAAGPDAIGCEPALDTGVTAWNSCAGHLPWGQPLDQGPDEQRSACFDWNLPAGTVVLGQPRLRVRLRVADPVAQVSAKLALVPAGGGPSLLVDRGLLNLAYRNGAEPERAEPGQWLELDLELEATAFEITDGVTLRLALACADWPNTVSAGRWDALDLARCQLMVPLGAEPVCHPDLPAPAEPGDPGGAATKPSGEEPGGPADGQQGNGETSHVSWRHGWDVLAGRRFAEVDHGSRYEGFLDSACTEHYEGRVEIDPATGIQRATGTARFTISWPDPYSDPDSDADHPSRQARGEPAAMPAGRIEVTSEARLDLTVDPDRFEVTVELDVQDGQPVASRHWHRVIHRQA